MAMIDEHSLRQDPLTVNPTIRKNGHVRIFVRRRPPCGLRHRMKCTEMEQLASLVETTLNKKRKRSRQKKNIIIINYKPVFKNTRTRKTKSAPEPPPVTPKQPAVPPFDLPEVEDPFMFIEEMYQKLFNDDGQLRQGTEPKVLANCVKQIVATSRRNSMARRESISSPVRQRGASIPSSNYLSHVLSNTFSEEEENEATSRRRTSVNTRHSHRISLDDTENEDWDRFSDLNTYRKTMALSLAASFDEDMPQTDSKLLSSSGYQSLKSPSPRYCSNCTQSSPSPIREMLSKYLQLFLVSKNILLIPLFIFFLRQRPVTL